MEESDIPGSWMAACANTGVALRAANTAAAAMVLSVVTMDLRDVGGHGVVVLPEFVWRVGDVDRQVLR